MNCIICGKPADSKCHLLMGILLVAAFIILATVLNAVYR